MSRNPAGKDVAPNGEHTGFSFRATPFSFVLLIVSLRNLFKGLWSWGEQQVKRCNTFPPSPACNGSAMHNVAYTASFAKH